jgi:hypothetical protein
MSYVLRLLLRILLRLLGKMCRVYGYCQVNDDVPGGRVAVRGAVLEG